MDRINASIDGLSLLNMAFISPFTFTRSSAQTISLFIIPDYALEMFSRPVAYQPLAYPQFKQLLHRYRQAGFERHYWSRRLSPLTSLLSPMGNQYRNSVVDTHRDDHWVIAKWHIQFSFSERLLVTIKHSSNSPNWYEDVDVAVEYMAQLEICFNSINAFHESFGSLPSIGDRLFNEDTGLMIKDRSIDGGLRTITFILSN